MPNLNKEEKQQKRNRIQDIIFRRENIAELIALILWLIFVILLSSGGIVEKIIPNRPWYVLLICVFLFSIGIIVSIPVFGTIAFSITKWINKGLHRELKELNNCHC